MGGGKYILSLMGLNGGKMFKKYVLALMLLMCGMLASVGFVDSKLVDASSEQITSTIMVTTAEDILNKKFVVSSECGTVFEITKSMEIENVYVELKAKVTGAIFKVLSGASVVFKNIVVTASGKGTESTGRVLQVESGCSAVVESFEVLDTYSPNYLIRNNGSLVLKNFIYNGTSKDYDLDNGSDNLILENLTIKSMFLRGGHITVNPNTKLENEIKITLNGEFNKESLVVKGDGVYAGCFMDKFKLDSKDFDLDYFESDENINGVSKGDLYLVGKGEAKTEKPDWLELPEEPTPEEKEEPIKPVAVEVKIEKDELEYNGLDLFCDIKATYEYAENTYNLELEEKEIKNAGEYELSIVFNEQSENYGLVILDKESVQVVVKKKEVTPKLKINEFVYNGQVPNLEVFLDRVLEGDNVKYTLERENVITVGENYEAIVTLVDSKNYYISPDKAHVSYKITKATIDESEIHFEDISKVYDGKEIVFESKNICNNLIYVEYVTEDKEIVNSGKHVVKILLNLLDKENYNELTKSEYQICVDISKKVVDTSECKFEDKAIEYGEEVEIKVENLPSGVKVEYKNIPNLKVVGTYDITAEFKLEDTHNYILDKQSICMKLIVTPKKIDVSNLKLVDTKYVYTGKTYMVEPPEVEGVKFTAKTETKFSDVGEHEIKYTMSSLNHNYELVGDKRELKATLNITPADYDISHITFQDKEVFYDRTPHSIEYYGVLPEGLETVECEKYVNAGEYVVTLNFKSTNPNYSAPLPKTATLKIKQRGVEITLKKDTFVYTGERVTLGYDVKGVLDGDNLEVELDYTKSINVGEYVASIKSLSHSGYFANTKTLSYSIEKAKSDISKLNFPSEEVVYTGEKYVPKVYGTMPGYLTYKIVEDKEIRNVGEYEIRVKFEADKNHETPKDLVAKINVLPKKVEIRFSDYMDLKYTGEKHCISISIIGMLDNEDILVAYSEPPIEAGNYTCSVALKDNSNYIISGDNSCVFNIYLEQKEVAYDDYAVSVEGGMFTVDSELKIQSTSLNKATKQSIDNIYEDIDVCKCFKILSESQENEVKFNVSLNTLNLTSKYILYLISQNGELTKLDYELKNNTLSFLAPTNSTFVLIKEKTPTSKTLYIVLISIFALSIAISIAVCVARKRKVKNSNMWD